MSNSKATTERRLRDERRDVAAIERKEPLRRRLLVALGEGASTPTTLSVSVGARKESVSRKLAELRDAGLVTAGKERDDRRRLSYSLTRAGRVELSRHLAFGASEKLLPLPNAEGVVAFLREALAAAVAMRRRNNRLQDAIDRMQDIYEQAKELDAHGLALEALAELATTQRQSRQRKERKQSLAILEKMAMGAPGFESQLIYPAIAHLEYERGKVSDLGPADPAALAPHLIASMSLFEQLIEKSRKKDAKRWRTRRAWSVVSLAHNLREQSRYEDSLRYAASGLRMFNELNDDYGLTQCWFLFGFCLRLLRRFDAAWNCLAHAHSLASKRGFERAIAYCLVQMGEVRRCQGETDEAKLLLDEALEAAERLNLHVARAFTTSALAALEFQQMELEPAQVTLRSAQGMFERCKHREGTALNARRQVTVARHLFDEGVKFNGTEIKGLLALAEDTYKSLDSPAGVAACEVERGWIRKLSRRGTQGVVKELNQLIKHDRDTLQKDAWAAAVLWDFAKAIDGDLAKDARKVHLQAELHLKEKGDQGVRRISELAAGFDQVGKSNPSELVIEMGGESRRRESPLALAA